MSLLSIFSGGALISIGILHTSIMPVIVGTTMLSFGSFYYLHSHKNARMWTICKLVLQAFLPLILWSPIAILLASSTGGGASEMNSVSATINLSSFIISFEILLSIIVWYIFNTIQKSK